MCAVSAAAAADKSLVKTKPIVKAGCRSWRLRQVACQRSRGGVRDPPRSRQVTCRSIQFRQAPCRGRRGTRCTHASTRTSPTRTSSNPTSRRKPTTPRRLFRQWHVDATAFLYEIVLAADALKRRKRSTASRRSTSARGGGCYAQSSAAAARRRSAISLPPCESQGRRRESWPSKPRRVASSSCSRRRTIGGLFRSHSRRRVVARASAHAAVRLDLHAAQRPR